MPSESELLAHIYARSAGISARHPAVVVGPGDDCAVVRSASGDLLLITVDQLVEGRHFNRGTPIDRIARKSVARSVSDIAAMAGAPAWGLATGILPHDFEAGDRLFDAMHRWAAHWGCPLVGGDIASHAPQASAIEVGGRDAAPPAPLALTVTVAGVPHPSRGPVLRGGARPGDAVYITGRVGGSFGSGRHLMFEPRVREGLWLADSLGESLHAMIDVSDGVGRDAGRIAAASGVRIRLDLDALPLHPGVTPLEGLSDGEDYELLFTAAPGASVPDSCPHTGTPLTRIGTVEGGSGCTARDASGQEFDATQAGWDH